jgi:hypothetical protein
VYEVEIISDTPYSRSTILNFEPGHEGTAGASIMSMAEQQNTARNNYVMNDYFLAEASDQIFEEGNVQAVNDIASAAAEMALMTNQPTVDEITEPEDGKTPREVSQENGKIALYMGEDESIEDATLAYVQDEDLGAELYDRVVETAEPAGRNGIEKIIE